MNWKDWLHDTKVGTGFIIALIVGSVGWLIYVYTTWNSNSEPRRSEAELLAIAEEIRVQDSLAYFQEPPLVEARAVTNLAGESVIQSELDSLAAIAAAKESTKPKPADKLKSKPKAKPRLKVMSAEESVRIRLRKGMSVGKIARETGLNRKYIRSIKKRKDCNCRG